MQQFIESCKEKRTIIIDGSNVAYRHSGIGDFSADGIIICIEYFKELGFDVKAVVPNFRVRNDRRLKKLQSQGNIRIAGDTKCDDAIMLRLAASMNGAIISNDMYRDFLYIGNDGKFIETFFFFS